MIATDISGQIIPENSKVQGVHMLFFLWTQSFMVNVTGAFVTSDLKSLKHAVITAASLRCVFRNKMLVFKEDMLWLRACICVSEVISKIKNWTVQM